MKKRYQTPSVGSGDGHARLQRIAASVRRRPLGNLGLARLMRKTSRREEFGRLSSRDWSGDHESVEKSTDYPGRTRAYRLC
jgi:hypothetical protein